MWNLKIQCTMTGGSTSQWLPSGGPAMYTENMPVPYFHHFYDCKFRCDLSLSPHPLTHTLLKLNVENAGEGGSGQVGTECHHESMLWLVLNDN